MSRSRTFCFVLYPDDESQMETFKYIVSNFDYAYILHDKDTYSNDVIDKDTNELVNRAGDLKKPHYHFIISFKNPRKADKLKEELKLSHIETCNFYFYSRYLIHLDDKDKYQYSQLDIKTNMATRINNALKREFNSKEEESRILLDYIFSKTKDGYLTFRMLTEFAMKNDCLLELQKRPYFYNQFCDQSGFRRY